MKIEKEFIVTKKYLDYNPNVIFVFGDNIDGEGLGGAAKLRHHPQSYGFITKKHPNNYNESFYTVEQYENCFNWEYEFLEKEINNNQDKTFLISKLGNGLANRYKIWKSICTNTLWT